jgi:hypothetical protein
MRNVSFSSLFFFFLLISHHHRQLPSLNPAAAAGHMGDGRRVSYSLPQLKPGLCINNIGIGIGTVSSFTVQYSWSGERLKSEVEQNPNCQSAASSLNQPLR